MSAKNSGKTYYSFNEIGQELFGLKPIRKVTKDKQKLAAQREKFLGTCPYCKQPLEYIYGTNVLACNNEDCKGKKVTINDEEIYRPYYKILSDKGGIIGETIFEEKEKK